MSSWACSRSRTLWASQPLPTLSVPICTWGPVQASWLSASTQAPSKAERSLLPGTSQTVVKSIPKGVHIRSLSGLPSSRQRKHSRGWDPYTAMLLEQIHKAFTVLATVTRVRQIAGGGGGGRQKGIRSFTWASKSCGTHPALAVGFIATSGPTLTNLKRLSSN